MFTCTLHLKNIECLKMLSALCLSLYIYCGYIKGIVNTDDWHKRILLPHHFYSKHADACHAVQANNMRCS